MTIGVVTKEARTPGNIRAPRPTTSSEPSITTTARDFLVDPNMSGRYMQAVGTTVRGVVAAANFQVERILETRFGSG